MLNGSTRDRPVLEQNLTALRDRIQLAARNSSRSVEEITLVAVTKSTTVEVADTLRSLGVSDLGESRLQEAERKVAAVSGSVRWHLIGHLQRNKVRKALPLFDLIHSVDSDRLLREIQAESARTERTTRILLQVNVSGEESKYGFTPDELRRLIPEIQTLDRVAVEGLMTMAPYSDDPEECRPWFRGLRELRDEIATTEGVSLPHLSMGMTNDFPVAVEEGSTLIRVGSYLFRGLGDSR